MFFPKLYLENILEITKEILDKNNIKGIMLDVDNTVMYYNKTILKDADIWCENLKKEGIKICIVSNSNNTNKVKILAEKLNIPYVNWAMKPLKFGFNKAKRILNLKNENIAVVGDQIFTDVWGANRMKMYSILVKPLETKDLFLTKIKRPIEEIVINKYIKMEGEKHNVYK